MTEEHDWHIELAYMRAQLSYALDNIDSISKRADVEGKLESVLFRIKDLLETTQGASDEV